MNLADVELLACVNCSGDLKVDWFEGGQGRITRGILKCVSCGAVYPVVDGVGVFFRREVFAQYLSRKETDFIRERGLLAEFERGSGLDADGDRRQLLVAQNWQYQWEQVAAYDANTLNRDPEDLYGGGIFWKFIPIPPASVKGKTVYVTCAGRGREAFHVLRQSPAKLVINEIGTEIYAIPGILSDFLDRTLLLRCDVCYSPLKPGTADITICDHALQHVSDHKLGFSSLVKTTKPGGQVCVCVYSRENNFLMTHMVEPMKLLLHRFPLWLQRMIAFFPATVIYAVIHLVYLPINCISNDLARRLPLFEHMMFWARNTFQAVWVSCFDLIQAPVSYHFERGEVENLAGSNGLEVENLVNTHKTLWSLVAKKAGPCK